MYDDLDIENRVYLIYCDIAVFRKWVRESVSADIFFSNYDKLCNALKELRDIPYEYHEPHPEDELCELAEHEQEYIQKFLSRSWVSVVSEASSLKTETARKRKITSFFEQLKPYSERFSEETNSLIAKAKNEVPDYNIHKATKAEKDTLFLKETERILSQQDNIMQNLENASGNFAWLYKNINIFYSVIECQLPDDVMNDIMRLMLAGYETRKAARFLRVKYGYNTTIAAELYVQANTFKHAKVRLKQESQRSVSYKITVRDSACPLCQKHKDRVYNYSDAEVGVNYPPLCRCGCSSAHPLFDK